MLVALAISPSLFNQVYQASLMFGVRLVYFASIFVTCAAYS
jgi:hypothetical protein